MIHESGFQQWLSLVLHQHIGRLKYLYQWKRVRPSGASPSSPYTMICQKHKPHNVSSKVMHDWVNWPPNCLVLVPYPSQNWTTSWIPKSMTYYFYSPSCKKSHHLHSHAAERYFTVIFHIYGFLFPYILSICHVWKLGIMALMKERKKKEWRKISL